MTNSRMTGTLKVWAVAALLVATAAGCNRGGGGEGDLAAFCRIMDGLETSPGEATDEQVDEAVDSAPPEIRDDVETLAEAFRRYGNDEEAAAEAFADEDVVAAGNAVAEFREEECAGDEGDEDDGAPGTTEPEGDGDEAASGGGDRFCEIANATESPSDDVLQEWAEAAPDEIAAEVAVLVEVTRAQTQGGEPPHSEEEVAEATTAVGAYISENCT